MNGKRSGFGKEYEYNKLKFEGEFLNGKKWNGKGYDLENNVVYELKEGKGFIKEYYYNGNLKYEGEYLNGKGKEYEYNKLKFEGEYLNGKRWNGKGYDLENNIIYEIKEGKGFIKEYYNNGKLKYEYQLLNGEKNGKGIIL